MADKDPIVVINAHLTSQLLHQQSCALSDEDGFLLGKMESCIMNNITDTEIGRRDETKFINIYDYIPCPSLFHFYNYYGAIQEQPLSELVNERESEVIGWYKIRRSSSTNVSFRENIIHVNLLSHFKTYAKTFIFGLFTSSASQACATLNMEHLFYQLKGENFELLKWKIPNLHSEEPFQYKLCNSTALNMGSLYQKTMLAIENSIPKETGPSSIAQSGIIITEILKENLELAGSRLKKIQDCKLTLDEEIQVLQLKIKTFPKAQPKN